MTGSGMVNEEPRRAFLRRMAAAVPAVMLGAWSSRVLADDEPVPGADATGEPAAPVRDIDGVEFVLRSEWTASWRPRPERMRLADRFERMTVHHWGVDASGMDQGRDAVARRIDGILGAHVSRNYGDIGYHFILDLAGRVWEGRSLVFEGAHVSSENSRNIGIMLLGNFQDERPSDSQLRSLGLLSGFLASRHKVPEGNLFGHCDLASSECPGRLLYPRVREIREKGWA